MRGLVLSFVIVCAAVVSGCWSTPAPNTTSDTISEKGVTQPPPPDPDKIAGNNPRDPKNRKPRPDVDPDATPEPTEPKPAPENSTASVMMNSDGSITEFRVFKDHPQIIRAEANWLHPNEKNVKVFLKGGAVKQIKTDKIPNLHNVPSSLLLEVVGVKPTGTKGDRPRVVANK